MGTANGISGTNVLWLKLPTPLQTNSWDKRSDEMSGCGGPRMASALEGPWLCSKFFSALGRSWELPFSYGCLEVRFCQCLGGNLH